MRLRRIIPRPARRFVWHLRQRLILKWTRPWRPDWLPFGCGLQLESAAHPHIPEERGEEFLAANTGTTEIEVLNWLHATVCLLKPAAVLETGTLDGLGTIALAAACRSNGRGHVHSLEIDAEACARARKRLARRGLARWATVHCMDSREFLKTTRERFELGFFDSVCELRTEEYEICLRRGLLGRMAAFHDTSPRRCESYAEIPPPAIHRAYRDRLLELANASGTTGWFESTLSRGVFVIFRSPTGEPTQIPGP